MALTYDGTDHGTSASAFETSYDVRDRTPLIWADFVNSATEFASDNRSSNVDLSEYEELTVIYSGFRQLISSRRDYLSRLIELGDNWISGEAKAPGRSAIEMSQAFLSYVQQHVTVKRVPVLPRLVLGPLPSGGVIVELHTDDDSAIYVTFYNDATVEVDTKYRGHFASARLIETDVNNEVLSRYESIADN
jgi:hypothetical protein